MRLEEGNQSNPWTIVHEDVKFDCPYFSVREDIVSFEGLAPRPYHSMRAKRCGVCVAPIDSEGCVTLVGQYRYVLELYTWELPGGGAEVGGDLLAAAKTELREETGMRGQHWMQVVNAALGGGTFDGMAPGYVTWGIEQGESNPEPEERLALRRLPFRDAIALALKGEINHLAGMALLLAIQVRLQRSELPDSLMQLLLRSGR